MVDLAKDRSRIAVTGSSAALLVAAAVVVGVLLGVALDPVAGGAAGQGWLPLQGLFDQVDRFAGWAAWWAQALVGAGVGAAAGFVLVDQATVVEVDEREVVVVRGSTRRRWSRQQVASAVIDGRHLSLRGHDDADLVREGVDGDVATLRTALARHGWPVRG